LYPPQPLTTGYQSKTVNKYGDETINQKANMTEKQYHILNNSKPIEIETSQTSRYALNEINDFIIWCKEKNIKPRITWPNTLNFEVYKENVKQEFFQKIEQYYNDMKISVLGKPEDFMYNKAMFYDTSYHLNDIGVRYRTQQIIELLRPDLERIKQVIN
jgi:flagellar basal body P-ring protein FlgI